MNKQFQGIYAVVVTPFHEDGTFDVESAKKNLDWLIEQGVQGVCILGATGEYQSISDEEHMAYVKEIVPYVKDRVSVIVGASRERPEDVVKLSTISRNVVRMQRWCCHLSIVIRHRTKLWSITAILKSRHSFRLSRTTILAPQASRSDRMLSGRSWRSHIPRL